MKRYCICRSTDVTRFMIGCDGCSDWFHGDCVNVTEKQAKYIKRYYCKRCRRSNPTLQVVFKSKYKEYLEREKQKEAEEKAAREERRRLKEELRERKRKLRQEEEEKARKREAAKKEEVTKAASTSSAFKPSPPQSSSSPTPPPAKRPLKVTSDEDDAWEPPQVQVSQPKPAKVAKRRSTNSKQLQQLQKRQRQRRSRLDDSSSDEDGASQQLTSVTNVTTRSSSGPKQCLGPKCIKCARPNSKYCSDQCGINLATARIYETLPGRIREWNMTPTYAEKSSRKELEKIRAKQTLVQNRLKQLHEDFRKLEEMIAKAKSLKVEENSDEEDEDVGEAMVHCVTCGNNVQLHTSIRHMERCYNKFESKTSFASKFKTQIEDSRMFCDYFNPKDQTYCKRLKVLCPEHNPDPKYGDEDVCGFPLQKELFAAPTEFCLRSKKTCNAHYCWEKLRRAEIDMERVKQWMKVDELLEQERQAKATMSNRAGVLGLMLHSTFNHEVGERMRAAQKKMMAQQQQQHQQQKLQKVQPVT